MKDRKHRFGDRRDGYRVRDTDSMHVLFPLIMPRRTDNEAVMNEIFDITALKAYLERKNADSPEYKYTFFHVILAAMAKTFVLRPKLNRFYEGSRLYDRKDITFSFIVKKQFSDDASEAVAIIKIDEGSDVPPIEQIYEKTKKIVYSVRHENKKDGTTDIMDTLVSKMPLFILKRVMSFLKWLDYHGLYPTFLMSDDPYFSSVFISNLGSIKMHASYHHLANWGTNSFFAVVGEKKRRPFFNEDGSYELRDSIDLGLTVDERIADGIYFANSVKILHELLENPELLELPIYSDIKEKE